MKSRRNPVIKSKPQEEQFNSNEHFSCYYKTSKRDNTYSHSMQLIARTILKYTKRILETHQRKPPT